MKKKERLMTGLSHVERVANSSKLSRFISRPVRYLYAIGFRLLVYPRTKHGLLTEAQTFFGKKMQIMLPAGTDIFLTKGKSHSSEIRLAKFLIQNLNEGDHFVDVGAHFGYFSLLAAELIGNSGKVLSIEASVSTFEVLAQNIAQQQQIIPVNAAISDKQGAISFYEFPVQFSEYNALDIRQYERESWYKKFPPKKYDVQAVTIAQVVAKYDLTPTIIKIDVEGAELQVITGAQQALAELSPIIVMEYLAPGRHNESHAAAVKRLREFGYNAYSINDAGGLDFCEDIDNYLKVNGYESDNLIFLKTNKETS